MRKWISGLVALALLAAAYAAWPFYGLYRLGEAVHAENVDEALRLVDVPGVRRSLVRQIVGAGAGELGASAVDSIAGQMLATLEGALDAKAERIITAEVLRRLLARGEFQPAAASDVPAAQGPASGFALPKNPLRYLQNWHFSSPSTFKAVLGEDGQPEHWIELTLRREGLTWRLTDVNLPESFLADIGPAVKDALD